MYNLKNTQAGPLRLYAGAKQSLHLTYTIEKHTKPIKQEINLQPARTQIPLSYSTKHIFNKVALFFQFVVVKIRIN